LAGKCGIIYVGGEIKVESSRKVECPYCGNELENKDSKKPYVL